MNSSFDYYFEVVYPKHISTNQYPPPHGETGLHHRRSWRMILYSDEKFLFIARIRVSEEEIKESCVDVLFQRQCFVSYDDCFILNSQVENNSLELQSHS